MNKIFQSLVVVLVVSFSMSTFLVPHAESAEATEDSWANMAEMPTARIGLGVAVVNGMIYAIGGYVHTLACMRTNERYDPATDTWTTKASMPTARCDFGIAVYQNKIYVIGGAVGNEKSTGVNEVYDPLTNTWETKKSMPTPRQGLGANVVNGKIYLIGGCRWISGYPRALNMNEAYDPLTDTWTTMAPIPTPVHRYSSAVADKKIYVITGCGPVYSTVDLTQIYTPETDTWNYGAPLPIEVAGAAGAATTGVWAPKRIYVLGGMRNIPYSFNQIYDPEKNVWNTGSSIPTASGNLGVAVVDNILYAIGGGSGWLGCYGWVEVDLCLGANEQYTPIRYGTVPPAVSVVSPEKRTYTANNVPLTFTANKPTSWIGYILDGQATVTIAGNTTLTGLSDGYHILRVYANDTFGYAGASEIIYFSIAQQSEPFPTTWIAATIVLTAIIGVGLLLYFVKIKKTTGEGEKATPEGVK